MIEANPTNRISASTVKAEIRRVQSTNDSNLYQPLQQHSSRNPPNQYPPQLFPNIPSVPLQGGDNRASSYLTSSQHQYQQLPSVPFRCIKDLHEEVVDVRTASFHPQDPVLACGLENSKIVLLREQQSSNWMKIRPYLSCSNEITMLKWNVSDLFSTSCNNNSNKDNAETYPIFIFTKGQWN